MKLMTERQALIERILSAPTEARIALIRENAEHLAVEDLNVLSIRLIEDLTESLMLDGHAEAIEKGRGAAAAAAAGATIPVETLAFSPDSPEADPAPTATAPVVAAETSSQPTLDTPRGVSEEFPTVIDLVEPPPVAKIVVDDDKEGIVGGLRLARVAALTLGVVAALAAILHAALGPGAAVAAPLAAWVAVMAHGKESAASVAVMRTSAALLAVLGWPHVVGAAAAVGRLVGGSVPTAADGAAVAFTAAVALIAVASLPRHGVRT